jgi:hypothetical protein
MTWSFGAGAEKPEKVLEEAELVWNGAEVEITGRTGLELG